MPGENIQDWSTTAATNSNADSLINWAEGMPRADVNNSARSLMAAHAKDRNLRNGSIVTGGTANAQTFLSGLTYTATPTGLRVLLKIGPGLTNTTAATLNMDSIGAVAIKDMLLADITGNSLIAGYYCEFLFNGTNWILISAPGFRPWTATLLTATNAVWPVPAGTKEMEIEVWGAGASGAGSTSGTTRGAGGGAGGYVFKYYAGTMDATLNVTIGAGGASASGETGGTAGGPSSVVGANLGTLAGGGGNPPGAVGAGSAGGSGGTASGGDLNLAGGAGMAVISTQPNFGIGGDSPRGGMGGRANVGNPGQVPGGGGSGENHAGGGSGAGANGRVFIKTR